MTLLFLALGACTSAPEGDRDDTAAPADTDTDTDTDTVDTDADTGADTADTDDTATDTGPTDAPPTGDVVITVVLPSLRSSLAWLPDDDADGRDGLAIGRAGMTMHQCLAAVGEPPPPPSVCPSCDDGDDVRVLRGRPGAAFSLETDADRVLEGSGCVGSSMVAADLDGDDVPEIVAGAPMSARGGDAYPDYLTNAGEVAVYSGIRASDAPAPEAALGGWVGDSTHLIANSLLVAGDMDGDGRDEVVTSVVLADDTWGVLPGDTWSAAWPVMLDHPITGLGAADMAAAGDVDGDGLSDLVFATLVGADLTVSLWPGSAGFVGMDVASATLLASAPGILTGAYSSAYAASVADGDGDGYGDAWVDIDDADGDGGGVFGVSGDAAARGEVLAADDLVRFSPDGGTASYGPPVALGTGEATRVAATYVRAVDEVLAQGILTYTASQLTRGAVLVPEDGTLLWTGAATSLSVGGDWDASGTEDLAFAVHGPVIDGPEGYAYPQYAVILLDP